MVHVLTRRDSQVFVIEPGIFSFQVAPRALNKTSSTRKVDANTEPIADTGIKSNARIKKSESDTNTLYVEDINAAEM